MAANGNGKVVINLTTGLEDAERVMIAFLVGTAALEQGKQVAMFLTKEAVRVGLPGYADAIACDGCPPLTRLLQQFADGGAPRVPDLLQHQEARGGPARPEREAGRRDAALAVGRRRVRDRVQLLALSGPLLGNRVQPLADVSGVGAEIVEAR
jgi:hypothetical protein